MYFLVLHYQEMSQYKQEMSLAVQSISVFSEQWSFSTTECLIIHDREEAKWCMSPTAQLSEELKLLFEKVKGTETNTT